MSLPNSNNGRLAAEIGYQLPVTVLRSQAGYYLGTYSNESGPVSRESIRYWANEADAQYALDTGHWLQRTHA